MKPCTSLGPPAAPITLRNGASIFLPSGRFPYQPRHFSWEPGCQMGTRAGASAATGQDPSLLPSPQVTASLLARSEEPTWLGALFACNSFPSSLLTVDSSEQHSLEPDPSPLLSLVPDEHGEQPRQDTARRWHWPSTVSVPGQSICPCLCPDMTNPA